jgi:hypothetical protein
MPKGSTLTGTRVRTVSLFPFEIFAHLYTTSVSVITVNPGYNTRKGESSIINTLDTGLRRYDD